MAYKAYQQQNTHFAVCNYSFTTFLHFWCLDLYLIIETDFQHSILIGCLNSNCCCAVSHRTPLFLPLLPQCSNTVSHPPFPFIKTLSIITLLIQQKAGGSFKVNDNGTQAIICFQIKNSLLNDNFINPLRKTDSATLQQQSKT